MLKTNAMRLLDARSIDYEPVQYSAAIHSGDEVARVIGQPAGRVFKTLVLVKEPSEWLLVMVPSDRELDLKKCASAVGAKRVRMATRAEAEAKTGLLAGGISPLALTDKPFRVYLDRQALSWETIYISAGQRGLNLRIGVADLLQLTNAQLVDAAEDA